ncbi:hypothetical protein D3C76_1472230 [compost metagenome]
MLYIDIISSSIPLKEDRSMINAALLTVTPITLIEEMILIALTDFFENRYLLANRKGKFISYPCINGLEFFSKPIVVDGP